VYVTIEVSVKYVIWNILDCFVFLKYFSTCKNGIEFWNTLQNLLLVLVKKCQQQISINMFYGVKSFSDSLWCFSQLFVNAFIMYHLLIKPWKLTTVAMWVQYKVIWNVSKTFKILKCFVKYFTRRKYVLTTPRSTPVACCSQASCIPCHENADFKNFYNP